MARVGIFLMIVVLIAGMLGCGGGVETYALAITSTEGGSVTVPGEGAFAYDEGTLVYLVATPEPDYGFAGWTGNVSTVANVSEPATFITMNDNCFITANFELIANRPPTINSLTANATWVAMLDSFNVTCDASDPNGDDLSYEWTSPGAYIYFNGTGPEVVCLALSIGTCNITVLVEDGHGGSVTGSLNIDIVPYCLPMANHEVEEVILASIAYFQDTCVWPRDTADCACVGNSTYCFNDYYTGWLMASYSFDYNGFINGVGDPGGTGGGTTSSGYNGIHWQNPTGNITGHGHWVVDY
jgi:hypothetical protein